MRRFLVQAGAAAALSAVFLTSPSAWAADDELPAAVTQAFRRAQIPTTAVAVVVRRAGVARAALDGAGRVSPPGDSGVLLSQNADRPMNPASTMKLVTTYAALELLGPAFTWHTTLATAAPRDGDTLAGDVVLQGGGDPKLVASDLWSMFGWLRGQGIRRIAGDLVLDRGLFAAQPYDPAAFDGEPYKPYNVGPDALLINFKALTLRFVPDETARRVRVVAQPLLAGYAIGEVAWADGPCGDWRAQVAPDFGRPDGIVFGGVYPASCGEQTWNVAVLDHPAFDAALVRWLWQQLGGTIDGRIREGFAPPDARVLVDHESPTVAETIRDINKYSNNVMARELYVALDRSRPASTDGAARALRSFLAARDLPLPELVVDNGSGLSRRERISARSMAALLDTAWASPLMPEFVASLPLVGLDGTMKRRLDRSAVAGQAHIKSGTLDGVRAVAGYVVGASGKTWIVVVFVEHPNAAGAQAGQDALLRWVRENG